MAVATVKYKWDVLKPKFGVKGVGNKLYVMEQLYGYKMTNERSIIEQAHEIQSIAKEVKHNTCVLAYI
jgi:hypothetical protein